MIRNDAPEATCAVVTDACCDLPATVLDRLGVAACDAEPKVVELAGLYRSLAERGFSEVVSIHFGAAVSAARTAAASVGAAPRVTVVDANLVSAALALVVERAAHAAAEGCSAGEVAAVAELLASETALYVISDPHAPRQGRGNMRDRLAYLRRRALGTRHLVRVTSQGHKVVAESDQLPNLTARVAHALSACAWNKGALCYIEVAGSDDGALAQLEKPFDTNEYISYRIAKINPAPTFARFAGLDSVGVAVVPESVYGGHSTTLFGKHQSE